MAAKPARKPSHLESMAQREREALAEEERRAAAKAEGEAVRAGVSETRQLSEDRGAAFHAPPTRRGEREKPIRRMSGLEWLHSKGRVDDDQKTAGERYGSAYRRAMDEASIKSILDDSVSGRGQNLAALLQHAEGTKHAKDKLAMYRRQLSNQANLIRACDLICGEERTPREATADGHEAGKLETALVIALDLMTHASGSKAA